MASLRSLVQVAPFDEETRALLNEKMEKHELDDSQEMQLSELCWNMITTLYQSEINLKTEDMLREMSEGKKYTQGDFSEEEVKIITRLKTQFAEAGTKEDLDEVHRRLEELRQTIHHSTTPNSSGE